jgi:plastocyanin
MKTTTKVGMILIVLVLGLVVSPAVALYQADAIKKTVELRETIAISNTLKTVMIVGHEDPQFVPQTIHLKIGDSIRYINLDGQDGGLAHSIVSVDENGISNGNFKGYLPNVSDTFIVKFSESGTYNYIDSTYPQMQGIIVVS